VGRIFLLGGAESSLNDVDFSRGAFSLMRGFGPSTFAGTRVALGNVEYRVPLGRPQRGVRTWPVFLHSIHAAAFGDFGSVWSQTQGPRSLKTSAGAELSFDLVVGYSTPLTLTIGSARGSEVGDRSARTTVYARLGKAF
jgi:outer membrane protein assembly factor BamA